MLQQRVADGAPVEKLEALPAQAGLGGHPLEKRRVQVEVQAVGQLLPPAPQGRHSRRYYRNLAAHDAGIAQAPAVHALPDVDRGPRWTMTAWAVKGGTSTSPEVCLKRSTLTPRQPLPSLEETVSTGATWEKSSTAARAPPRAPSFGVTRSPSCSSGNTRSYSTFGMGLGNAVCLSNGIETRSKTNFLELRKAEVRRIRLPRTRVNKGKKKQLSWM